MATVDELIVQIKADTRDLNKKLGQLERSVGKASNTKAVRGLGLSLSALKGPAIAATAAIAGIGALSVPIIRTGAAFEDMRISLETVFGSAAAGQQAFDDILRFATESPFQINDLTQAFIQLGAAGIKPQKELLDTFAGAASVTTDSLGAFQALVRITQRSMGGGLGLEELEQLAQRGIPVYEILAQKIGVTRTQISVLGQSADGAKKIMDALNEGLEERFGDTVAKKMETLNQKFSNLETAFQNIALAMFNEGGLGTVMKDIVITITNAINGLATLVRMAGTGMSKEFLSQTTDEGRVATLEKEIAEESERAEKSRSSALSTNLKIKKEALRVLKEKIIADKEEAKIQAEKQAQDKLETQQMIETNQATMDRKDRIEDLASVIQSTVPESEKLASVIAEIEDILKTGSDEDIASLLGGVDGAEALKVLRERLEELQDPIEKTAKLFDENMIQAIVNTSTAFTNDFVNALLEGQSVLDSFANFAKNIVSQIIATFLQLAVVNKILNAVFSGFSGFTPLPTLGASGGGGSSGGGSSGGGLGMFSSGGRFQAGRPMVVGERGPELMIPNSGGKIMNNHSSRMAMGGDGVVINQNLNFSTGVVPTVRSEIMKMLPTISDVTKASVLEAASRGGTYRRGLLGG